MSLKIENVKKGMTFWESNPYASVEFVAEDDGYLETDENKNEYWVVNGKEVNTENVTRFYHLVGFSDYPQLCEYNASESFNEGC